MVLRPGLVLVTGAPLPVSVRSPGLARLQVRLPLALLGLHVETGHIEHLQGAVHGLHLLLHGGALGATCRPQDTRRAKLLPSIERQLYSFLIPCMQYEYSNSYIKILIFKTTNILPLWVNG